MASFIHRFELDISDTVSFEAGNGQSRADLPRKARELREMLQSKQYRVFESTDNHHGVPNSMLIKGNGKDGKKPKEDFQRFAEVLGLNYSWKELYVEW
jgi:hypothetical protein